MHLVLLDCECCIYFELERRNERSQLFKLQSEKGFFRYKSDPSDSFRRRMLIMSILGVCCFVFVVRAGTNAFP